MTASTVDPVAISAAEPSTAPDGLSPAFWQTVRGRRSIRRYAATPVSPATLTALLTAASWAPSAHNRQPWRFCVVIEQARKEELSHRMGERWRTDLAADGASAAEIERRVAISRTRLTTAPALVVPCVAMEDMDTYADERRNRAEWLMAVQSVALACQNLLLAAHDAGLGACWMCAPLFAPDVVCAALELPAAWEPQAMITVGYPAEVRQRERAPLASRILWR